MHFIELEFRQFGWMADMLCQSRSDEISTTVEKKETSEIRAEAKKICGNLEIANEAIDRSIKCDRYSRYLSKVTIKFRCE